MRDDDLIAAVTGGPLPRHVDVRAGALTLHCLEWGEPDAPPLLLVHGNGGHAHWWDALVPHFLPAWRLLAPDLRGHGASDWPAAPAYGIADVAADLLAVVDQRAGRPLPVIAHSMGARAAAWFAARHADRVRGLALLDTSIAGVDEATARRWRGRVAGMRQGRGYASYDEAIAAFRFVPPEPGVAPPIVRALAHFAVRERGAGDWAFRFDRAVLSLDGDGAGDLTALVRGLRGPLWIGRGRGSFVTPAAEIDALRAARPDIAVHDFAGAHHFFLSDPSTAGRALRRFVDALGSG